MRVLKLIRLNLRFVSKVRLLSHNQSDKLLKNSKTNNFDRIICKLVFFYILNLLLKKILVIFKCYFISLMVLENL